MTYVSVCPLDATSVLLISVMEKLALKQSGSRFILENTILKIYVLQFLISYHLHKFGYFFGS